ncbi:MAG: methionine biosynthesis protein MetW [Elusimicrobiota bacterium]|jgi:methionine biosynthesis protein MetW|nr:methionine biosynthesis protein MetW [Elusimicrobiota bacterium]
MIPLEYEKIASMIKENVSVLDLGCGRGDLLEYLTSTKHINGQGIEIKEEAVFACIEKGLTVFHSDIEKGLDAYPSNSFDYVLMYNSIQEIKNVDTIIKECFRIGKTLIVGFPNFAQISSRKSLLMGYTPITKHLPFTWFNSPNIRFFTIRDFENYARSRGLVIEWSFFFSAKKEIKFLPNLFAYTAIFAISKPQ